MMFGEFLIKKNNITRSQVVEALELQKYTKKKLGRLMVQLGFLTEEKLNMSLCLYFNAHCLETAERLKEKIQAGETRGTREIELLAREYSALFLGANDNQVEFIATIWDDSLVEKAESLGKYDKAFIWVVSEEVFEFLKLTTKALGEENSLKLIITKRVSDDGKITENLTLRQIR